MKKKLQITYIIYIVLCILLIGYQATRLTEQVRADKYGLSTDDTVELSAGSVIAAEFEVTGDAMQGVSVKFQSENQFHNEMLSASLFDFETEELLASDIVELKNERIQNKDGGSSIYFELPLESAKGRRVRLEFALTGEDVRVQPSFVVSESKVSDSVLTVGCKEMDMNLVFSVRYSEGTGVDIAGSVMDGLLWILAGTLIFVYLWTKEKDQKTIVSQKTKAEKKAKTRICWHRKALGYVFLIGCLGVVFVYVYKFSISPVIYERKVKEVTLNRTDNDERMLTEDSGEIKRIFTCSKDKLSAVMIDITATDLSEDARLRVTISDAVTGRELAQSVKSLEGSDEEGKRLTVRLNGTLEKSDEREIEIALMPIDFGNTKAEVTKTSAEYGNVFFLKKMFAMLCVLLLIFATVIYVICFVKRPSIEKSFVAVALIMGILISLVIGLDTVPDEPSHIDTAYAISNELMGLEESTKPGYIYKRACDVDMAAEEKQSLNAYSYERLYQQLFTKAEDETLVECAARSNLNNAGRIYYLPQALGITAGRLLCLGMMPTMMLGRLFSLICYVLITYFALKKLPIGKLSLFLIGILPITLQQAASFSYDGMINAIAFLYVSYCLHLIYGDKYPDGRDMLILVITGCMMADVKGGVYVALCLFPLVAVFVRKEMSRRQKWSMAALTGVMLFAFAGKRFASILGRFMVEQGTVTGGAASTEIYTFGYLLRHPFHFIGMFVNTFYKQGDSYLRNLLGGNLGWREVNINWAVVFGFLLVILFSCIVAGQEKRIGVRDKICFGGISFAAFFCVELSMLLVWTPITYKYITGVQGRYFIPFFLLILLVLRNSFVSLKRNIDRQLIFAAGMLDIVTLLQVIQKVLE